MAFVSENSLVTIVRAWILMLIFCFANCAAGSCLSYGHSCWGAHGKRSGGHAINNANFIPTKTIINDAQQETPSFAKDQWILSRLIVGQPLLPTADKYRSKWNNFSKLKAFTPQRWENDEVNSHIVNDNSVRGQNNNEHVEEGDGRKMNEMQDLTQIINEENGESPEIFLISRNDYNKRESKPQNVDLFKLLSKVNDNME